MTPLDVTTFLQFLEALRDETGARLCGSYARGDHDLRGHISDIDLVVKDGRMQDVLAIFERFGVEGDSCAPGHWASPRNLVALPRPVEVFEPAWPDPEPSAPSTVSVFGVEFVTYRRPWR